MVVYTVWDRAARVRFPAPRQNSAASKKPPFGGFLLALHVRTVPIDHY